VRHGEEAIRINPNSVPAHLELAMSQYGKGHYEEALAEMEIAMRLSPRDPHLAGF
jgi:tetratricopeptide (TPR) repeat protein